MTGAEYGVPLLPGNTVHFPVDITKNYFRPQTLKGLGAKDAEGVPNIVVESLSPTGKAALKKTTPPEALAMTRHLETPGVPRWVSLDCKVLRFFGYFKEAVTESYMENYRVRKVIVFYYLRDDTLQVSEPRAQNAGIPQGIFVKRHVVTRADGSPITPRDLAVGTELEVYGRTFYLTGADDFTRDFYTANDCPLGPELAIPGQPLDTWIEGHTKNIAEKRAPPKPCNDTLMRYVEAKLGKASHVLTGDTRKDFMRHNRRVLRFFCMWDEADKLGGDRRPYVLHVYLEDNTIEVLEVHEPNSGRDLFPLFLKRGKLPRDGAAIDVTRPLHADACIGPQDFYIGAQIPVHGRHFFVYDCDEFTRRVLETEYGVPQEQLKAIPMADDPVPQAPLVIPAWNGYGSLEDTVQNCIHLVNKPPKKDFIKELKLDRVILRFVACLREGGGAAQLSSADLDRRFIVSFYLADDTVGVFEPPVRNSGIIGNKFLERQQVFKPKSTEIFTCSDAWVGAVLEMHKRVFQLIDADEFTLKYMEQHADQFSWADATKALKKLKAQISEKNAEALREALLVLSENGGAEEVHAWELLQGLQAAGVDMVPHEVLALVRQHGLEVVETIAGLLPAPKQEEEA